jgi:hypothetical protein
MWQVCRRCWHTMQARQQWQQHWGQRTAPLLLLLLLLLLGPLA